jgi:hypothetical protein
VPLADFVGAKPMYGIKTGLNEAFLIDDATRTALVRDDPGCAEIIVPYLGLEQAVVSPAAISVKATSI